jgi:HD-GYP domain-containing protein (c-di-GMP phosphodiesterase class II)
MLSHRPYRPALGMNMAREEFSRNNGLLYDQGVVNICLNLLYEKQEALIFGV